MKRQTHQFSGKVLSWQFCVRCGLITLANDATRQAMREGCDPKSVERRERYGKNRSR